MLQVTINDQRTYSVSQDDGQWTIDDVASDWDLRQQSNGLISILYNGRSFTAFVESTDKKNKELTLRINGQSYKISVKEPIDQLLSIMGMDIKAGHKLEPVKAPMPGMVLKILVEPGQQITKGDGILILEAMKMENLLKASGSAIVKSIKVSERMAVEKGAVLIELE